MKVRCVVSVFGVVVALCLFGGAIAIFVTRVAYPLSSEVNLPAGMFAACGALLLLSARDVISLLRPTKHRAATSGKGGQPRGTLPGTEGTVWHATPIERVMLLLASTREGITADESARRLRMPEVGPNEPIPETEEESVVEWLLKEIREPTQALLLAVAVLYFTVGELYEAFLALGIIAIAIGSEVFTERRAKSALRRMERSYIRDRSVVVLRPGVGQALTCPPSEVVPGDVLALSAGSDVPADAVLLTSSNLECGESSLTGESAPVMKSAAAGGISSDGATVAADVSNVVRAGTSVTRGRATAVVFATGRATQLGEVAFGAAEVRRKNPKTPLQKHLGRVALHLTAVSAFVSVASAVAAPPLGTATWREAVLAGLALAFATIPEELPLLVVAVLAVGGSRLSSRGVFPKRLHTLESLPLIDVVVTDKTGTITWNKLRVASLVLPPSAVVPRVVALSDGRLSELVRGWSHLRGTRDPVDSAVLDLCTEANIEVAPREVQEDDWVDVDIDEKVIGRKYRGSTWFAGAPETVVRHCTSNVDETTTSAVLRDLAASGMRVIGYGVDGRFLGAFAFEDPIREESTDAVSECHAAGIDVVMVTGDHASTADAVARSVGITGGRRTPRIPFEEEALIGKPDKVVGNVIARATPKAKLDCVLSMQRRGHVVAVTGDGFNDAQALAAADIGVAVGGASDAARNAAGIAVVSGGLHNFVSALREGRRLHENLSNAVAFYLAEKLGLVIAFVACASVFTFPMEPVHVVLSELFMDVGASLSFVAEPAPRDAMRTPPRSAESISGPRFILRVVAGALSLGTCIVLGFCWGTGMTASAAADVSRGRSVAFLCWLICHVLLAFAMRTSSEPFLAWPGRAVSNVPLLLWLFLAVSLAVLCSCVGVVGRALFLKRVFPFDLAAAAMFSVICTIWLEVLKLSRAALETCCRLPKRKRSLGVQ